MTREALSSIDTAWLRMEDPTHPMMITALLVFDEPIEFEQLRAVFQRRLLPFPRFRQRVVRRGTEGIPAFWEEDPSFDLDHHLKQTSLPAPADEGALRSVVSDLMSRQLDLARPLWQFHLVGSYGSGCALVGRVHHCLADGPALVQVLLALIDADPHGLSPVAQAQAPPASPEPGRGVAAQLTELIVQQGIEFLFNPFRFWSLARLGTETMASLSKLLWRTPDPETILRGKLGAVKQVAWSRPVALVDVKAIGRTVGGTVNDVMLTAATGALRRYLESHGQPVQGLTIRAGLSVNLRAPDTPLSLGNRAGAVLVDLPLGLNTPRERLQHMKRRMDDIKSSPEASVVWGLLNALGQAPEEIQDRLVQTYCTRETAVVANVPGPGTTVYLAGAPLSSLMFWVPALGGTALCLSIVSYAGQVWFGAGTDQGLIPDPEEIVAGFHAEIEALRRSTPGTASKWDGDAASADSIQAMKTLLDEAIGKLDALLEDQ